MNDISLTNVKRTCCARDCPDRAIGCHGKCEKYKAYRAECDQMMDKRYQNKRKSHEADQLAYDAIKRLPGKRSY